MANSVKARFQSIKLLKNEQLGIGSYGMVCKAVCDGLLCAAKLLHPTIASPRNSQNFDQECQVLSAIKHPNVIQYLGTHQDPETRKQVLIMELMDESLTSFVERAEKDGRAPLPLHVQLNICHEIALALRYLHQNDIIHRDLSSNNVLSLGGKRFKVTDFGMSKLINSGKNVMSLTQCPGCPAYMSPGALETPPVYSNKLDIFSFGVLTIQILTCRFPDPGPPKRKVRDPKYPVAVELPVFDTERRKSHIDLIPSTHPLLGISKACLSYQEEDRPTAVELCDHISGLKLTAEYIQSVQGESEDKLMLEKKGMNAMKKDIEMVKEENEMLKKENEIIKQKYFGYSVIDEDLEIDKKDLVLGKELGIGQFEIDTVIAGKWKTVDVAIKMKKEWPVNEDNFIAEAKVMKALKHENLVRLCGMCTKQGPMYIVTEYLVEGSLLQYIRVTPLPSDTHIHMAAQICSAMAYLEVNRFIHRDLAARNCFVGERNLVKVGHFERAIFVPNDEYIAPGSSTFAVKWAAPEVLTYGKFSSKSDVWSYGILLWELLTGGKNPYTGFTNSQAIGQVTTGYRLDKPKDCPLEVCRIMDSTWQESPEARPAFKELLASLKQLQ